MILFQLRLVYTLFRSYILDSLVSIRGHDSFSNLTSLCLGRGTSWCRYLISAADYDYGESWRQITEYSRVNVFEEMFRGVVSGRFGGVNSGRFGGVEFGVKWDRFIHWLVDRFLAYLFPDLCGAFPRDPPECAKIPPRVHQKWPPKTPLFSPFFPNFPPKTGVSDSDISDFGHFPRFLGHNST
jgi:hypothetical protein